jgi:hypothetical protein
MCFYMLPGRRAVLHKLGCSKLLLRHLGVLLAPIASSYRLSSDVLRPYEQSIFFLFFHFSSLLRAYLLDRA